MTKIEKRKHNILNNPNLMKTMIIMSLPLFFSNLLKSFHDIVDSFFIARMDASKQIIESSLAAINIHWSIYNLFNAFGIGLAVAAVGIVSQYVGAKQEREASLYSAKLVSFGLLMGTIVMALLFFSAPLIASLMGAENYTYDFFIRYIRYRSIEFPFYFVFAIYQAIRQARGDTTSPVILSVGSIIWNLILTWILVGGMNMGIDGAGISTLSAQIVVFPFVIYGLFFTKKHPRVHFKDLSFDKDIIKEITRFALPSAFSSMISSLGFAVIQSIILSYGEVVSSGFSTGNRISSLLLNPVLAIGSVQAAFVGQNIGAGNKERAKKAYTTSRNISVLFMLVGIAIAIPLAPQIIELIIGNKAPEINKVAQEYVVWLLLTQPMMAIFNNYMSLFNGSGNNKYSLAMSLIRLWLMRIPLVLFFKHCTDIGYSGIWYAMVIGNVLILFVGFYLKGKVSFEKKVKNVLPKTV